MIALKSQLSSGWSNFSYSSNFRDVLVVKMWCLDFRSFHSTFGFVGDVSWCIFLFVDGFIHFSSIFININQPQATYGFGGPLEYLISLCFRRLSGVALQVASSRASLDLPKPGASPMVLVPFLFWNQMGPFKNGDGTPNGFFPNDGWMVMDHSKNHHPPSTHPLSKKS